MRTTKSTTQALERLTTAAGWTVEREGVAFVLIMPGVEITAPTPKKSARALALLVSSVRHREDWPALREATAYDPGLDYFSRPSVPQSGMAGWEEDELIRLALGR